MAALIVTGRVLGTDADAVAVEGDRIVAVGTAAEVRERVGRGGELLSGAAMRPGSRTPTSTPRSPGGTCAT